MQSPAPGDPTQASQAPAQQPPPSPPGYGAAPPAAAGEWGGGAVQQQAVAGPAPGMAYAGFWWRFLALLIDGVLMFILLFIGGRLFVKGIDYGNGNIVITEGQWWYVVMGIIDFLYYPVTWALLGETIGHRILGMEIRRVEDGQRPTGSQVIVRYLGYILSALIIGIGFIIAAFDPRKQGLHDRMASTVVVRKVTT